MTDIQLIRDLDTLKKMYRYLFNAVTDAVNICNEHDVKDILISAPQFLIPHLKKTSPKFSGGFLYHCKKTNTKRTLAVARVLF